MLGYWCCGLLNLCYRCPVKCQLLLVNPLTRFVASDIMCSVYKSFSYLPCINYSYGFIDSFTLATFIAPCRAFPILVISAD